LFRLSHESKIVTESGLMRKSGRCGLPTARLSLTSDLHYVALGVD
jgi:hypothetical protein